MVALKLIKFQFSSEFFSQKKQVMSIYKYWCGWNEILQFVKYVILMQSKSTNDDIFDVCFEGETFFKIFNTQQS